jgi:hypothetical protein
MCIHARVLLQPARAHLLAYRQKIVVRHIVRTAVAEYIHAQEEYAALILQIVQQTLHARVLVYAVPLLHAEQAVMSVAVLVQWDAGSTDAMVQAIVMIFGNGQAQYLATRLLAQVQAVRTHAKQAAALMQHVMVSNQVIAVDLVENVTAIVIV